MRVGCTLLALMGLMYATVGGLFGGTGDAALGLVAVGVGVAGLGFAHIRGAM